MTEYSELITKHTETLNSALQAIKTREFYARWAEAPSGKIYGEDANANGEARFKEQLNNPFSRLLQTGAVETVVSEESPYGFPLGITYPVTSADVLVANAHKAQTQWASLSVEERSAVLIECLEKAGAHFFELAYATMHTTGQGFVMSFQASGPHSYDRALEAIATGYLAQSSFVGEQTWVKPMGKFNVTLQKKFRTVPRGVNCTIGCSTFPVWNSLPGMFASLITGNATIAKVHPGAIYPLAVVVASFQQTLSELGLDPNLIQLGIPNATHPLTEEIIRNPLVGSVDYTGSSSYGDKVEAICRERGIPSFTEKAGVNCVIVESTNNLSAILDNLAFSVSLYSGQMCTAPQNFFVPASGISVINEEGTTNVSFDEFCKLFADKVQALVSNEKMSATFGAIQNANTLNRVQTALQSGASVILNSTPIPQVGFDQARTASPVLLLADESNSDLYSKEWFGPISFIIKAESFDSAVEAVSQSVKEHGALTTSCYTVSAEKQNLMEDAMVSAGVNVAFNFTGPIWINQSSAYSDFHGTGANPAGNAAFADLSFVTQRYHVIGVRICG
jgi:phenylacetic acid degradation protein paaN